MIKEILSEQQFQTELDMNQGVVLIKFGSPYCIPCKTLDLTLENVDAENNVTILKVNVDNLPQIASEFRIMSVPTTYVLKNKEALTMIVGAATKETFKQAIDEANGEVVEGE